MPQIADYAILDHLLEGCQVIDFSFCYVYVNHEVVKQGKKSQEELLGHAMMEVYPGIENTPMFSILSQSMKERKTSAIENEFVYPDGSSAWFLLKMEPVPEGIFILSIDISQNKQAELDLHKQLRRIETLREIDMAIISTTNLNLALKTILEKVSGSLGVDAADILLLNPYSNILEYAVGRGFRTKEIEKTQLRLGQGHAGRAALEEKTIFVPDLARAQEPFLRAPLIEGEGFVSFFAVPLVARGNLMGVLEIFHRSPLEPDPHWFEFFEALGGQTSIAIDSIHLFQDLKHTHMDLMLAYDTTIEGWSKALDLRDKETEGHTQRVTEMTVALARAAGIPENEIVHVRRGALLHDIGKMGVPDAILLKPAPLTDDEWVIMRRHPSYAYDLLYPIEYLRPCLSIPQSHHEKFDGTGYPQGLKGERIPFVARLFAVVDVWDALRFDRPYRKGWPEEKVLDHIQGLSGTHFDPAAVELFLKVYAARA